MLAGEDSFSPVELESTKLGKAAVSDHSILRHSEPSALLEFSAHPCQGNLLETPPPGTCGISCHFYEFCSPPGYENIVLSGKIALAHLSAAGK